MPLLQLVYASNAAKPFEEEPLKELVAAARTNNARLGITGLLLYKNASFFQVIEGEEGKAQRLFEKIRQDKRHQSVVMLHRRPVELRSFPDWSMGFTLVPEKRQEALAGFLDFLRVRKFPDLVGDTVLTDRILNGFKGGPWRAAVQPA
jgi:Sensors of blue-light using FAD